MRMNPAVCAIAGALAIVSCGGSDDPAGPAGETTNGIVYSARANAITASTYLPGFNIILTLSNPTGNAVTVTYPAGCPVRVRLYRLLDDRLMYDETKVTCQVTSPATMTLQAGQTRTVGSGSRENCAVAGDSIVMNAVYRFTAVPQMEGATTLELPAGELNLPGTAVVAGVTVTCGGVAAQGR